MTDNCNFADDTIFLARDIDLKFLMERPGHDTKLAMEC